MKRILLILTMIFTANAGAQYYVSFSGGYSFEAHEKVLGRNISPEGITDLEGSYGAGANTQIRGGYYFNDKIAIELSVGHLFGQDQQVRKVENVPTLPEVDLVARGRVFGASISGVYNITNNFYARAGLLTKLRGKTEANGSVNIAIPVLDQTGTVVKAPAPTSIDFTTNFRGEFPLGFVGAIGYKFKISEHLSLFTELEYININVTRNKSQLAKFNAVRIDGDVVTRDEILTTFNLLASPSSTLADASKESLKQLSFLFRDEFIWGTEGTEKPDSPNSSIGFNFGLMYKF
ncbi:outer membrane beta-barrel protein [Tenacibaculum agarivorans]|uniref:outer membrane beta-barrel protein n=1 Tax=Tenacibaculum agarivorans TaxID=1908389 RepID=UPI00094B8D4C|nr:outer membrane beta-barrel protein [Tenacibaculum agarivorans]